MTANAFLQLGLFLAVLLALVKPLGWYLAQVAEGKLAARNRFCARLEYGLYRLAGIQPEQEMTWKQFALALLFFNLLGFAAVYLLQRFQMQLPLNPQHFPNVRPDSAFNTAISFITGTNWQNYAGENTLSYFTQMFGLAVQNFFSAATGAAVLFALIRGLARHDMRTIGNFWADITRVTLYVLLPFSFILAVLLMSQGVIQNFDPYPTLTTLEQGTQTLTMGPVASQEAIKELGINGGGFFNANSAHPFENPTPFSNFLEMLAILLIPAALCDAFGRIMGDARQGWTLLATMTLIFVVMACCAIVAENGNMEGKETRFGAVLSALFATITTAASCGAVNATLNSFMPLGKLVPLWLMQLGEVVFGGVGSGLYGMLIFAMLAVFIAGLMIGRTPEYLGKKIESYEMKMVSLYILITPFLILIGTALSLMLKPGQAGIFNTGTAGFTEVLYAFSSTANNNGSALSGLSANTFFYNIILSVAMWFGRFWTIIPVLAIAGSLAAKKKLSAGQGSLPTHGLLFIALLISTIILVGALTFFPALALGPIVEHLKIAEVS